MRIRIYLLIVVFLTCFSQMAIALDDTSKNRESQAERYLKVTTPKEMMDDMTEKVSSNLPLESRELYKNMMTKHLDIEFLTSLMKNAMIKHFTADELKALADFYGSPIGKSAMKKFGAYMADIMPHIQTEIMKAQKKAFEEMNAKKK